MKKITKEKVVATVVSVAVFVSIIYEMFYEGISAIKVTTAIKDSADILVSVLVFLLAIKIVKKEENPTFREGLEKAMESVENSYKPLIREHIAKETNESDIAKNKEFIRYDLAKDVDALFGKECNDYMRFFEIKAQNPKEIKFFVRKKFFGEPFEPIDIAKKIKGFCEKEHENCKVTYAADNDGANITISFDKVLESEEDIKTLLDVIDDVLFLYVAECKKR